MPVTLTSFQGIHTEEGALLSWSTASEINSAYYEIQKSTNIYQFRAIGTKKAAGLSNELLSYSFTDFDYSGPCFYRLKQYDFDGSYTYSALIYISEENKSIPPSIAVYPNPFSSLTGITIENGNNEPILFSLTDISGKTIWKGESNNTEYEPLLRGIPPGIYFLTGTCRDNICFKEKLIKY